MCVNVGNVCLCVLFVGCCVMLCGVLGRAYCARLCVVLRFKVCVACHAWCDVVWVV